MVVEHATPGQAAETGWARKKRATRTALQRAAVRLAEGRGLAAVTVDEIAAEAGVSPRTFFNYFPTKEDAVVGWDPGLLAELVDHLRARPAGEPPLQALGTTLLEVLAPDDVDLDERLRRLRLARSDPHLMAHQVLRFGDTERELVAALAERRGTDPARDHYAALVVATVLAAGRAALVAWGAEAGRRPLEHVLHEHFRMVGDGLAEPERSTT